MRNEKAKTLLAAAQMAPDTGDAFEIGCIREDHEVPTDGYSTVHLARFFQGRDRFFFSIDTNMENVEMANDVLRREKLKSCVVRGDGKDFLECLGDSTQIAFLFLDSHRDPQYTLDQFLVARKRLLPGAMVCVDDAHSYDSWDLGKATYLAEYLDQAEIPYEIRPTETGFAMMVFRVPENLELLP